MFEDEEILPEERPQEQVPPALGQAEPEPQQPADPLLPGQNQNLPPRVPLPDRIALAQRQREAMRAVDAMRALEGTNGHIVGDERYHHGKPQVRRYAKKGKERDEDMEDLDQFDSNLPTHTRTRVRPRSPDEDSDRDPDFDRIQRKSFSRRLNAARISGARRRAEVASAVGSSSRPSLSEGDKREANFEFTFRATPPFLDPQLPRRSFSEPRPLTYSSSIIPSLDHRTTSSASPVFPTVELQPPVGPVPFSFRAVQTPSPASLDDPNTPSPSSSLSVLTPQQAKVRRPPLPSTTLPTSDGAIPASPQNLSPAVTPLESPSLATYRAPEEFEAGPSRLAGYFDGDADIEMDAGQEDMEAEHGRYFEEPEASAGVEGGSERGSLRLLSDEEGSDDQVSETPDKLEQSEGRALTLLSDDEGSDDEVSEGFDIVGESEGGTASFLSDEGGSDGRVREAFEKVVETDKSDEGEEEEEDEEDGEDDEGGEYDNEEEEDDEEEEEEEGAFLFEVNPQWDEEGMEVDGDEERDAAVGEGAGVGGAGAPQPQQGPVEAVVAPPEVNDELDGNVEDDMEGAMEGGSLSTKFLHHNSDKMS